MKRDVGHTCGHVVEWEADTSAEIAFGFFAAELAALPCPFCGSGSEPWRREIRFGSTAPIAAARFPELVARRRHPWGA